MLINNDSIAQFDGFTHAKLPAFGLVMATGSVLGDFMVLIWVVVLRLGGLVWRLAVAQPRSEYGLAKCLS
ncbi:Uncharacterised protein [Moraxella cuniculi]|uniref:Uncharacterized protein n=1 Tax=Moraxella cuniculi TaxID=34061 RepID=A0A3S4R485_9GAMM|nr:Uncharacterised protein [Moraxella cuniculi]